MSVRCWDASGRLIADVGDYNVRYLGRQTITYPARAASVRGYLAGLSASGSFGVVIAVDDAAVDPNTLVVHMLDNAYDVISQMGVYQNTNIHIDLYGFA